MLCDTEGFAIPFTADDRVIECGCNDPDHGEPANWPEWTDAWFWEPGPEDMSPTAADIAWLAVNSILPPLSGGAPEPFVPTAADWADYHAFCREVDERHELARTSRLEDECRLRYGA
jgi:hypothetical protein